MAHDQKAMIEAHQRGLTMARVGTARDAVNIIAHTLTVDEGDAMLAGYYCELRRIAATDVNRVGSEAWARRRALDDRAYIARQGRDDTWFVWDCTSDHRVDCD
jgi:hypothetical protein